MIVQFYENNSGGYTRLDKSAWKDLSSRWIIEWRDTTGIPEEYSLPNTAWRIGLSLEDAIKEWEGLTGFDSTERGCRCCGRPFQFDTYKESDFVEAEE